MISVLGSVHFEASQKHTARYHVQADHCAQRTAGRTPPSEEIEINHPSAADQSLRRLD